MGASVYFLFAAAVALASASSVIDLTKDNFDEVYKM
jgi:hypothetical protein